jgi:hypothetical protein
MDFQQWKIDMIDVTGLAKDALHIHIGLLVFVLVRLVWRWRGGWLVAWAVALGFAVGGEWLDILAEAGRSDIQPDAAHWHDVWNTMLWPTIFLVIGRWLQPRPKPTKVNQPELIRPDEDNETAAAS